jgi:hypothetical protein
MLLGGESLAAVPLAAFQFSSGPQLKSGGRAALLPVDNAILSNRQFPTPQPFPLGAMGYTDIDGAWVVDCSANMTQRGTTIEAINATNVMVQRVDQRPMGAMDITVSNVAVQSGGLKFIFDVTAHGLSTQYLLGFPLSLANGDLIVRWGILTTIPHPG